MFISPFETTWPLSLIQGTLVTWIFSAVGSYLIVLECQLMRITACYIRVKDDDRKWLTQLFFWRRNLFFFSCSLRLTVFITYSDVLWVQRDLDSNWKSLFPYSPVAREKCWHCTFLQTTDPASADPCWDVGRTVVAWQLGEMAAKWDTTVSRRSFNIQVSEKPLDPFEEMWGHFPDGFFWHVGTIFRFF